MTAFLSPRRRAGARSREDTQEPEVIIPLMKPDNQFSSLKHEQSRSLGQLKIEFNYLEKNKDIFLLGASYCLIDSQGNFLAKVTKLLTNEAVKKILPKHDIIHHPTMMFRNEGKIRYREKFDQAEEIFNKLKDLKTQDEVMKALRVELDKAKKGSIIAIPTH